jgi:hypothetical protein
MICRDEDKKVLGNHPQSDPAVRAIGVDALEWRNVEQC